jgi:phenylacetate-CoA ligase
MFLNEKLETMPRKDIGQIQIERLQATLNRVAKVVPFYRSFFKDNNFSTSDFQKLEDIRKLPLISRSDLVSHYPYGMFAVPLKEIVRLYPTSFPFEPPLVVGYTQSDIIKLSKLTSRVLFAAGITKEDVVLISFTGNIFNGSFVVFQGAEMLGASVIPCTDTGPEDIIKILSSYRVTKLITTPYIAIMLSNAVEEKNVNPGEMFLQSIILGGEILAPYHRKHIESTLMAKVYEIYGLNEIFSPGVGGECGEKNGLHINEDHFIAEIINPRTLAPAEKGQKGELVLTSLNREGFPLIRYRTGNLTAVIDGTCGCGRSFIKIQNITGHTDGRIIVDGIPVYPRHIEKIFSSFENDMKNYRILITRESNRDRLEVEVGVTEEIFGDEMRKLDTVVKKIKNDIFETLKVNSSVRLVEPKSIPSPWALETNIIDKRQF